MLHWHDIFAVMPWPNQVRSIRDQLLVRGRYSPIRIDSMFATIQCVHNSPNGWGAITKLCILATLCERRCVCYCRLDNGTIITWTPLEHIRREPLVPAHWMPIYGDRILRSAKTPNYWPSRMPTLLDLAAALGWPHISCWLHDAGIRSILWHVQLVASPDDNELMHGICNSNQMRFNINSTASMLHNSTYLAHKYNVYTGANLKLGTLTSRSAITSRRNDSWWVSGNSRTAGKIGSCPALLISAFAACNFGLRRNKSNTDFQIRLCTKCRARAMSAMNCWPEFVFHLSSPTQYCFECITAFGASQSGDNNKQIFHFISNDY